MIRILRPAAPPAILSGKGVEFAAKLCEFYASGQREFTFAATVYAHASVKDALIEAQHGKCCFCERKVFNDGDVEHFRPKGGVRESPGSTLEKPGYYWLAYEWTNLFLSCGPCNSRNKRNMFPLADGSTRSRCHGDDCSTELPIFIDPSMENPELLIGWRSEVPFAVSADPRATATIRALGLDRPALREIRREHLVTIAELLHYSRELKAEGITDLASRIDQSIEDRLRDSAEFAAATRAFRRNSILMSETNEPGTIAQSD